jgi:RNA polymerase sigma-70 factor (ECF subfamily)
VNTLNEEKLIQAAQNRNLQAFQQLVHGFDRPMLHLALRITGTEQAARSLYCESMLKLYTSLTTVEFQRPLSLCAYRIVANLCLEYLRTARPNDVGAQSCGSCGLTTLSPRERVVFELRHYAGLDLRTVGLVLDTTEEVTRNVLLRARQKLYEAPAET